MGQSLFHIIHIVHKTEIRGICCGEETSHVWHRGRIRVVSKVKLRKNVGFAPLGMN